MKLRESENQKRYEEETGVEGGLPGGYKDRRGIHGTYLVGREGPAGQGNI